MDPSAILVGLDADMSAGGARSGEAIRRGALLAIDEINGRGGVLGRPLRLVVRDHRGNPDRGNDNIAAFAGMDRLVAVLAGLHTPVALHELETIHRHEIVFLVPWAAGTPVVSNGHDPNYVFRVSVRDEYAGGFLTERAVQRGFERPALFLEQTGWGRSNEKAICAALKSHGMGPPTVLWFHWGVSSMTDLIAEARAAGCDVVMLVANAREGATLVESMVALPAEQRLPILSHWGITGGKFYETTKAQLDAVSLEFLQTYSFLAPPFPERSHRLLTAYGSRFPGYRSPRDIFAPVGTAHAYDLVHLLALAIAKAATVRRPDVRNALERLDRYEGLVRDYDPPFTPRRHDALDVSDFRIARFGDDGAIVPVALR